MIRYVLLLALCGCASQPFLTTLPNGDVIVEVPNAECPDKSVGTVGGCYVHVVGAAFYPEGATSTRQHELEHAKGGEHSDWLRNGSEQCAVITVQGRSDWKVGNLICRRDNGQHYQKDAQQTEEKASK